MIFPLKLIKTLEFSLGIQSATGSEFCALYLARPKSSVHLVPLAAMSE